MKKEKYLVGDLKKEINITRKVKLKIFFPRFIYTLLGRYHQFSQVMKINDEKKEVESPFINQKKEDFIIYNAKVCEKLDSSLHPIRTELLMLLNQYDELSINYNELLENQELEKNLNVYSVRYLRKQRSDENKKDEFRKQLNSIMTRMRELLGIIQHLELLVNEEIIISRSKLLNIFNRYIQGGMKRDYIDYIPEVSLDTIALKRYKEKNKDVDNKIYELIKDKEESYVNK